MSGGRADLTIQPPKNSPPPPREDDDEPDGVPDDDEFGVDACWTLGAGADPLDPPKNSGSEDFDVLDAVPRGFNRLRVAFARRPDESSRLGRVFDVG